MVVIEPEAARTLQKTHYLGELQILIMRVLWAHKEATASDVHAALLPERSLAPTTVATMLKKMEHRGLVAHRTEGRRFVYYPAVSEAAVMRSMVEDLAKRLFDGRVSDLACHLISEHEIEADELNELTHLIAEAEKKERSK